MALRVLKRAVFYSNPANKDLMSVYLKIIGCTAALCFKTSWGMLSVPISGPRMNHSLASPEGRLFHSGSPAAFGSPDFAKFVQYEPGERE